MSDDLPSSDAVAEESPHKEWVPLDLYAENAYLEYAISVVKGRALPEVADGQKPVQRRILYAMYAMGLAATAKPVKSARVVGEILGKYHPHGDSSAYEALVRMAQSFTLRYALIDGQGNFGSRDGDNAAAMRYTEARLTPISELLLSEINMGTVDMVPNYDGAFEEPKLLPARLPMILLNGASGIAVGLATDIPSHNLTEVANACVALLENPELDSAMLLQLIPGPDFPGGGQIITPPVDIGEVYRNGRGSLRVRARWEVERLAHGQWRIIVTQLPPGSSAQKVLAEIEEAINPKLKAGKRALSQEQHNLKSLMLSILDRVRDESDSTQPVRLVFEPKSSRQSTDEFVRILLAQTSLERNISLNLVTIGLDGRPQQRGLKAILAEWLQFRQLTVTRRTEFRLSQVNQRILIIEGRIMAFIHIDTVIDIIRSSDDPKHELMQVLGLVEIQVDDILEIRLRQLARLEGFRLEKELAELQHESRALCHLLSDASAKRQLIIREIRADMAKYGDERRTEICVAERALLTQTVVDEAVTIILSQRGWLRARITHTVELTSLSFKDGDALYIALQSRTVWPIIILDTHGRAYTIDTAEIANMRGDSVPVASLIDMQDGAEVAQMLSGPLGERYVLAHSGGYGFVAQVADMASRVKAGKSLVTLQLGERLLGPVKMPAKVEGLKLMAVSDNSRVLVFPVSELRALSKGRGLMLMRLERGEQLTVLGLVAAEYAILSILTKRGRVGQEKLLLAPYQNKRAKRGALLPKKWTVTRILPAAAAKLGDL